MDRSEKQIKWIKQRYKESRIYKTVALAHIRAILAEQSSAYGTPPYYMRLSKLQKFILMKCFEKKNKTEMKTNFYDYYPAKEISKNKIAVQVALQNSIENLVKKDLVVAIGHRTVKKWYVNKVRLTAKGKKKAKELVRDKQRKLPIK